MSSTSNPSTPARPPPTHTYARSVQYPSTTAAAAVRMRSPVSPSSSPYTPLSHRSFASSSVSSALATPNSIKSVPAARIKKLNLTNHQIIQNMSASPSMFKGERSLADIAYNWRSRASEHGIKVSSGQDSFRSDDDDDIDDESFSEAHPANFVSTEDVLLPPPFLSNSRRRSLSQSLPPVSTQEHVSAPKINQPLPSSPFVRRNLMAQNRLTATPPQNRNFTKELKMKGSLTDPAHTRRREAFGVIPQVAQNVFNNNADASLDLFDIREHDYEFDHDEPPAELDDSHLRDYSVTTNQSMRTAPYPLLSNTSPQAPLFGQPTFSDPFSGAPRNSFEDVVSRSVDEYLQQYQHQYVYPRSPYNSKPHPMMSITQTALSTPSVATSSSRSVSKSSTPRASLNSSSSTMALSDPIPPTSCSVCSRANPARLAILAPCQHPLCSSCLTSALNIVGEKDMECAVCRCNVEDFKLISASEYASSRSASIERSNHGGTVDTSLHSTSSSFDNGIKGRSFMEPLYSSPGSAVSSNVLGGLDSAFEFVGPVHFSESEIKSSTPPPGSGRRVSQPFKGLRDPVVLRIDNVPWDITPPTVTVWLQQPVKRVHVLLDKKGKTMSHAFVEVDDEAVAGAILRGEVTGVRQRGRGAVLGKGRRARGVTITRSSQEELMAALFPSWRGMFNGCRPSFPGVPNERGAFQGSLLGDSDISSLLYLIRSPNAHFLKVPCLPFHVLMSILSKFPVDVDGRMSWAGPARDGLFGLTNAAVHALLERISTGLADEDCNMDLVEALLKTANDCQVFIAQQLRSLHAVVHGDSSASSSVASASPRSSHDADVESVDADEEDGEPIQTYHTPNSSAASSEAPLPSFGQAASLAASTSMTSAGIGGARLSELAKEFNVEPHLIEALAQRLSGVNLV